MKSRQSTDKPRYGPAVAIAAMIFGILWLVVFHPESPRSGTVIAQGTVVDQDITRKGLCAPIAELQVNNASYTVKSGISAEPCDYAIGDAIEVSYHPEDIAGTLEAPPAGTSYPVVLAPVPGVLFLAAGAISLIRRVAAASKAGMTRR